MPRDHSYFVYILASRSRQLYVGMTSRLQARVREDKRLTPGSYAARYKITRLVYYEQTQYVLNAIARETEIKEWNRERKIALIEGINPLWEDLSERFGTLAFYADKDGAL